MTINPSIKDLEVLIGNWTAEISNASFLPDLSTTIQSVATFEWFEEGEFLVLRLGTKVTPHSTWLIGRDQDFPNYTALYFDDRHVSRVYEMSFNDDTWKIWRNAPNFMQSFEGKISEDRNTIVGAWSKSFDGKEWEHDFDLLYKRKI
ncbi:hypothetical protein [Spirosoma panaciterrae]|uniref:hypothetical protein n=1 Tax=Spirosoma panaciterrae TaxID=496058 RepID=UPI000381EC1F|nr:hypothetical protein [Spirosoma panaciterrae]